MGWNGSIPYKKVKVKSLRLRNKRKQNSPKALIAKRVQAEKRAALRPERFDKFSDSQFDDY